MRKIASTLLAATLGAAALAGCSGESGSVNDDPPSGSNAAELDDEATPAEEEEPSEEPEVNPTFGQAYTWDNGLTVTIGVPTPFEPSEFAYVDGEGTPMRFDVTVVNGTGANYEPGIDYITVQSGSTEAIDIFDVDQLGDTPSTVLLDGREAQYSVGFLVSDPADLVLEFQPGDYELASVVYTI